ncbi:DUF421 domain-containing protein [Gracilibacillus sp. S3-1-1]|uniref:DUF421 domain-containing protein n=1 Tax=Gracilibacillus pellucidus TaxID=3095368 RepID=A0ACC6M4Q8_9BACI|nr:DUF421 domain-containing protein [Gracilibacillus sp. S3-1-1]MDX8045812.1 DUF421 domain-containing protein [Gracilibacillus sp. S3-1-1]
MHFGSIFVETLFGFFMLFIVAKILGKTQIKQLTAFDFISALILGELVGNALYDNEVGVSDIAFAVLLWGGLLYLTEQITQKFKGTRALLEGKPSIVIHKGKLQWKEMKKAKLDINQLLHLLRSKDAFSIREVDYAILETDGTVSVMKKTNYQMPNRHDFNLAPENVTLPFMLINDGEIIWDSLYEIGKDEEWLKEELQKQEINNFQEVFYAEYEKDKNLFVQGY